ncbi:MAG: S1C family serine protease [Chitinophagales bacterium]
MISLKQAFCILFFTTTISFAEVHIADYQYNPDKTLLGKELNFSNTSLVSDNRVNETKKDSLLRMLSGIKYAVIQLTPTEEEKVEAGQYSVIEQLAGYLRSVGFQKVVYKTKDKTQLLLSVPTYCDVVRVRFNMTLKEDYFENIQLKFQNCRNEWILFTHKEKIEKKKLTPQSLSQVWEFFYNKSFSYNIQNRLQLPSNPILTTKEKILDYLKTNTSSLDSIEGIFEKVPRYNYSEKKHVVAICKNPLGGYNIIYIEGASNYLDWKEGEWMGNIHFSAMKEVVKPIEWTTPDKILQSDGFIELRDENTILLSFKNHPNAYEYKRLRPTVSLTNTATLEGRGVSGSGILVDRRGYIVTSYNVIENRKNITVTLPEFDIEASIESESSWPAIVVFEDQETDLALLQIQTFDFELCKNVPYTIQIEEISIGEKVFTLGYPLVASMGLHPKLAVGAISSINGYKNTTSTYQTSVQVYAGNSGSPLFDYNGSLVGILKNKHAVASKASYALKSLSILEFLRKSNLFEANELPTSSTLKGQPLTEQIKKLQPFVFYIQCY